ncbi:GNAT family N-acetyltransferase [Sutcliffiella horikoshii]|uniref:GNAT family N-acetyltransferase n=1 Tax=Sutcliffiella horikoshii TaxID=79883 RepID=A0A5D4T0L7_9BACI|nr:GNAT family N-acetyltransferase [Sutcliffiella horikoshii]TYS68501.1 GNAT family N-acetyltransferase [Sutcliffiella horikoshii]
MQQKAFRPLLAKYRDFDTNPANESIDKVITRIKNTNGEFLKIVVDDIIVGAICVVNKGSAHWISPMFILPEYQGKGIAQKTIISVEERFMEATSWELATILEEGRNCYLYEKMGYVKTSVTKEINNHTTLIFYRKEI